MHIHENINCTICENSVNMKATKKLKTISLSSYEEPFILLCKRCINDLLALFNYTNKSKKQNHKNKKICRAYESYCYECRKIKDKLVVFKEDNSDDIYLMICTECLKKAKRILLGQKLLEENKLKVGDEVNLLPKEHDFHTKFIITEISDDGEFLTLEHKTKKSIGLRSSWVEFIKRPDKSKRN